MDYLHEPSSQRSSSDLSKDILIEKSEYYTLTARKSWWRRTPILLLHATLISFYTAVCFVVVHNANNRLNIFESNIVDTPARVAIKDVKIVFDHDSHMVDRYFGIPSDELDDAWNEILNYGTLKFSKEEMTNYGRNHEGVELADHTGYMGTLNVFHELHCLKRIYMYIYKDEYYGDQNLTEYDQKMNLHHTMHCLDSIRQGVQCRADASPVTYLWGQKQKLPLGNFTSPHECKNWDGLFSWVKENSFNPFRPGLVLHPIYGAVYDDKPSMARKLGIVDDKALKTRR